MIATLIESFEVLNVDKETSTISSSQLPFTKCISVDSYIVSDADEELLILVEFKKIISLQSLKIYALSQDNNNNEDLDNASPPKHIHIYKTKSLNINFDDIEELKVDKSIICSSKNLIKGQNINLLTKQTLKFNKTKYLVIYISSNQNDTENTYLNGITFNEDNKPYKYNKSTVKHNTELEEFIVSQVSNTIDTNFNEIDMKRHCNVINQRIRHIKCEPNNISECLSLSSITKILHTKSDIYCMGYSDVQLLEDFHHLLIAYVHESEDIYNILTQNGLICNLSQCQYVQRNYRDRSNELLSKQLYCPSEDDAYEDIVHQQLIDRIHCYFLHSFDFGYIFPNKNKQQLLNKEQKNDDETLNGNEYDEIAVTKMRQNRFQSGIMNKNTAEKQNEYSFGFRYFYWKYYKVNQNIYDPAHNDMSQRWLNNLFLFQSIGDSHYKTISPTANEGCSLSDWYVPQKYSHLKKELLSDEICCISLFAWKCLEIKAKLHMKGCVAGNINCCRPDSDLYYGVKKYSLIQLDHLIAMMAYCNYDRLQRKLTETYRMKPNETRKELIERHSNYHHWGRLLRECVECFGMEFPCHPTHGAINNVRLYHGVSKNFVFSCMFAFIKGPFSTTTNYSVAITFVAGKGMILELDISTRAWIYDENMVGNIRLARGESNKTLINRDRTQICCFECNWLSDFPNEEEIFCVGGLYQFTFEEIINVASAASYCLYIKALKQMTSGMSAGDVPLSEESIEIDNGNKKGYIRRTRIGASGMTELVLSRYDKTEHCLDYIPATPNEYQLAYRLLAHQLWRHAKNEFHAHEFKDCPEYVQDMMERHCRNITCIFFKNLQMIGNVLHEKIFKYDWGWINIKLLLKMFPNTQYICFNSIYMNSSLEFLKRKDIYNCVLSVIKRILCKLRYIEITIKPGHYKAMKQYIETYEREFGKYGWDICVLWLNDVDKHLNIDANVIYYGNDGELDFNTSESYTDRRGSIVITSKN